MLQYFLCKSLNIHIPEVLCVQLQNSGGLNVLNVLKFVLAHYFYDFCFKKKIRIFSSLTFIKCMETKVLMYREPV